MYLCFLCYINYCFFLSQHDRYNFVIVRQELAKPLPMEFHLTVHSFFSPQIVYLPLIRLRSSNRSLTKKEIKKSQEFDPETFLLNIFLAKIR